MSGKPGLSFLTPFLPSTSFLGVHSLCWDLHPPARDGKGEMVTYPLCPDCHSQRCLSSNNTVPKQLHSFWGIKCSLLSHVWLFVIPWTVLHQAPMDCTPPGSSIYKIFQARMLGWVAIPFSRGTSQPRDQTWLSRIAGRFLHCWTRMLVDTLSQSPYDSLKCQACIWVDLCKENWEINPSLGSSDK